MPLKCSSPLAYSFQLVPTSWSFQTPLYCHKLGIKSSTHESFGNSVSLNITLSLCHVSLKSYGLAGTLQYPSLSPCSKIFLKDEWDHIIQQFKIFHFFHVTEENIKLLASLQGLERSMKWPPRGVCLQTPTSLSSESLTGFLSLRAGKELMDSAAFITLIIYSQDASFTYPMWSVSGLSL